MMTSESHVLVLPSAVPTTTWTGFLTVRAARAKDGAVSVAEHHEP